MEEMRILRNIRLIERNECYFRCVYRNGDLSRWFSKGKQEIVDAAAIDITGFLADRSICCGSMRSSWVDQVMEIQTQPYLLSKDQKNDQGH